MNNITHAQSILTEDKYHSIGSFKNESGNMFLVYVKEGEPFVYITGDLLGWELGYQLSDNNAITKNETLTTEEYQNVIELFSAYQEESKNSIHGTTTHE